MRSPATRAVATRWSDCLQRRGELVACKVFRGDVSAREEVARQREFRAMTQLKHQNIVRFIAVEQEVQLSLSLSLSLSAFFCRSYFVHARVGATAAAKSWTECLSPYFFVHPLLSRPVHFASPVISPIPFMLLFLFP